MAFLKPGALRRRAFKMSSKSLWSWINSAVTRTLGSSNPETFSWCNQIKAFATLLLAMVCTARETFMMFLLKWRCLEVNLLPPALRPCSS